jgi:hypothetical protein
MSGAAHMQCCCVDGGCDDWATCAPPQITIPRIVINREQRTEVSNLSCDWMKRTLEIEILDSVWQLEGGCYTPVSGTISVDYQSRLWRIREGEFNVTLPGVTCPDCLECCLVDETTFTTGGHIPLNVLFGKSICCVFACGPNTVNPLIKLTFNEIVSGLYSNSWRPAGPAAFSVDTECVRDVYYQDEPWTFAVGFNVWLQSQCPSPTMFNCRSVDAYTWDLGPPVGLYNGDFFSGRLTGAGGDPLRAICNGEYAYERPACYEKGSGAWLAVLNCLEAAPGVVATHYDVSTCPYQDAAHPDWHKKVLCFDPTATTCEDYYVHTCWAPTPQCTSSPPSCPGFYPNCNADGLLGEFQSFDKLTSVFSLVTIP